MRLWRPEPQAQLAFFRVRHLSSLGVEAPPHHRGQGRIRSFAKPAHRVGAALPPVKKVTATDLPGPGDQPPPTPQHRGNRGRVYMTQTLQRRWFLALWSLRTEL